MTESAFVSLELLSCRANIPPATLMELVMRDRGTYHRVRDREMAGGHHTSEDINSALNSSPLVDFNYIQTFGGSH